MIEGQNVVTLVALEVASGLRLSRCLLLRKCPELLIDWIELVVLQFCHFG